ncbi:MAG: carbohydrate ABC transporter substrate-binding protein [Thermoanaerobacteraceae bacterium]|nr:carbohydrate ABC transporter substrate-binding protein [Thermoanaerobacteraceae bacterium]
MKKTISILLIVLFSGLGMVLSSCDPTEPGEKKVDPNKTQLYVGFYEGGWGREWIDLMIEEFERIYPDYQVFAEGKKSEFTGENLRATIDYNMYDMYFTTIVPHDMVAQDKLMDITDIVTTPLSEYGEDRSIEEKMDEFMKIYMKSTNNSDKYYTIPFYTSFYYMVYDVDLFEEKKLFYAEDGSFTGGLTESGEKPKSKGKDNELGTYDDGLPVTWEDYRKLLSRMVQLNLVPVIWAGDTPGYRQDMLTSLWASHEGPERFSLNYTFDGYDDVLDLNINTSNGYELQRQAGKKYALEFAEYIIKNNMYYSRSFDASLDYRRAQDEFLYSKYKAASGEKRIAMLLDGGWWENEAKDTINLMAELYKGDYINRRFGMMPFPKFDENSVDSATLYSVTGNSTVFIRKNAKQPEIAKKFLRFTTTDANLRLYTRVSGSTRPYDYQLTEDDLSQMSYFKRSLWDVFKRPDTKVVYSYGPNPITLKNASYFRNDWNWTALLSSGNTVSEPFSAFKQYPNLTAQAYFDSLYNHHKNRWTHLNF